MPSAPLPSWFRSTIGPTTAAISEVGSQFGVIIQKDLAAYFGETVDHVDKIWQVLNA
jgi:hypothetical protein